MAWLKPFKTETGVQSMEKYARRKQLLDDTMGHQESLHRKEATNNYLSGVPRGCVNRIRFGRLGVITTQAS